MAILCFLHQFLFFEVSQMLQEIIVRKTRRLSPNSRAELGFAVEKHELNDLKPNLDRILPCRPHFSKFTVSQTGHLVR
jgi:hypothetical protein